jgi:uncharacterized integral membrane protein
MTSRSQFEEALPSEREDVEMATWTNKQWGALIAGVVVFLIFLIGLGEAAVVVLFAILGYFIGKFLDGELDTEDLRARAQGRR